MKVKHSTSQHTVQFVQCVRSLPVRYHPTRNYDEMYSYAELFEITEAMNTTDSADDLDKAVTKFLKGMQQANILKDQVKEAARCLRSSVINQQRSVERLSRARESRMAFVYVYMRVSVNVSFCVFRK